MTETSPQSPDATPSASPSVPPSALMKIVPPLWIVLLIGTAIFLSQFFDWRMLFHFSWLPLAAVVFAGGFGLMLWGRFTFAAAGAEIIPTSASNSKLITAGPFNYTRNPMYFGLTLLTLGIALYVGTLPYYAVPVIFFLIVSRVFVPMEEAKMRRQFGDKYDEYCRQVRRWI